MPTFEDLPGGLFVARETTRPFAALLGLTQERVRRSMVPPGSAVYLTAADYMPALAADDGAEFDADAWLSALLCQQTRDEHLAALATLNHVAQKADLADGYERDFLQRAEPSLAHAVEAALRGDTDVAAGQPRVFLPRHVILRAIRLVAHLSPVDEAELAAAEQRTGRPPRAFDPVFCGTLLVHAVAVGLGAHATRTEGDHIMGGLPVPLAMETICGGAFVRQGNHGNLLGRTLLLYRDYGRRVTKPLRATPLELVEEALGMPLLQPGSTAPILERP